MSFTEGLHTYKCDHCETEIKAKKWPDELKKVELKVEGQVHFRKDLCTKCIPINDFYSPKLSIVEMLKFFKF